MWPKDQLFLKSSFFPTAVLITSSRVYNPQVNRLRPFLFKRCQETLPAVDAGEEKRAVLVVASCKEHVIYGFQLQM